MSIGPAPLPRLRTAWPALLDHLPWLVAVLILLATLLFVPAFRVLSYWQTLPGDYFVPAVLALALTPIMLTGGIDLSVGSVTALSAVVAGVLIRDAHWPIAAALAAAAAAGLLAGFVSGSLVTLGVVPLVATLATRELFRGLASAISRGDEVKELPSELQRIWKMTFVEVPLPLLVFAVLAFLTYAVVHHTWIGRMVFAIGDNETAARFAGVPVRRLKLGLFAASGLLAGLCGAADILHTRAASVDLSRNLELTAIACVVLGGVRVTGGRGHVAGTLLGIATVTVLVAGLIGVGPTVRDMALGSLVIGVAVAGEAARRL
jgi:ribose/xylose/arabinose/galactoside ABC-type transport system permease subunit